MTTTLPDARKALHALVRAAGATNPTYAPFFTVLLDYLDNQVSLNIENNNLMQRLARAEGFVTKVRDMSALHVGQMAKKIRPPMGTYGKHAAPFNETLYGTRPTMAVLDGLDSPNINAAFGKYANEQECIAFLSKPCDCAACRVRAHG